ncbi:MAG: PaaI family thioesterase [Phycisphaerae bacterium]
MNESQRERVWNLAKDIPCVKLLHLQLIHLEPGLVHMTAQNDRRFNGAAQGVHGGILSYIADCAAWFAIVSHIDPKTPLVTTDLQIRYLAPCESETVNIIGRLVKLGRTLCPTTIEMFDANNKAVALAQVCYMRLDGLGASS